MQAAPEGPVSRTACMQEAQAGGRREETSSQDGLSQNGYIKIFPFRNKLFFSYHKNEILYNQIVIIFFFRNQFFSSPYVFIRKIFHYYYTI